jgi:hypothetical protein
MMKKLMILGCLVLMLSITFSYTPEDLIWDGYVKIDFDKDSFLPNENITGSIIIINDEDYPIVGEKLVFQIGEGEYKYPSQYAKDNIFFESVMPDVWVLPNSIKSVPFSLAGQQSGTYHLDFYSWIVKSKFVGSNAIFYGAQSSELIISGDLINTRAQIVRSATKFGQDNTVGPQGFPVSPNETFSGVVAITNPTSQQKNDLKLIVSMCDWSSAFCESTDEKIINVPTIASNQTIEVNIELTAPTIPSAYEINLVLKGVDIESIYKSRVIVAGGTAKVRKVYVDGLSNKNYSLNVLFAGSPDHFRNPTFDNFEMEMEIYDENRLVEKLNETILTIATGEISSKAMNIESKIFTKACVRFVKNNTIFEEECFTVPIEEIQKAYDAAFPELVKVNWNYNESVESLDLEFYKERTKGLDLRVRVINSTEILTEKIIKTNSSTENLNLYVPKENLVITIDDFYAKEQVVVNLELNPSEFDLVTDENEVVLVTCTSNLVCSEGTVCNSQTYNSVDGACCPSECVDGVVSSETLMIFGIPFIFWIAIVIFIGAVAVLGNTLNIVKKGGKK